MAVSSAPGYPEYSGSFIPEIWSGKLVEKFVIGLLKTGSE